MAKGIAIYGDELRKIREQLFLTQAEMASKLEVSVSTVQRIEGKLIVSVGSKVIRKLAETVGADTAGVVARVVIPEAELQKIQREDHVTREQIAPLVDEGQDEEPDQNIEVGSLTRYYEIPTFDRDLAAGKWTEALFVDESEISREQLEQGLFRVHLRGDSMEPKYKDGSVVEFRVIRVCREGLIEGGDFYIQRDDEMATFKRVEKIGEESVTLRALNVKKYPKPMTVERSRIVRCARAVQILTAV